MQVFVKQISSLIKNRSKADCNGEFNFATALAGEHFSYQIATHLELPCATQLEVISELSEYITVYQVQSAVMDVPARPDIRDDDYLTLEPGLMPDILMPVKDIKTCFITPDGAGALWVEVCIPKDFAPGTYTITINLNFKASLADESSENSVIFTLDIIDANLPKSDLIYTQWFHTDCISSAYNVPIYSDAHWDLIEKYMRCAKELGLNMILMPLISPPLDTMVGTTRPDTQLVTIEKKGDTYHFDFTLVKKWIALCKKVGIQYYEISHLFSQWGAMYAPNIYVTENGEYRHRFGWHVASDAPEYVDFLKQLLPAFVQLLKEENIKDYTFFHLSDEPAPKHLTSYATRHELLASLLDGCHTMDALSNYEFYEKGLVETPVCATDHLMPFVEKQVKNLWAYTCTDQGSVVGNRFMGMPSYRNRILGLQLYKYDIKGFLQWGFNFYYSWLSCHEINPYVTTSADGVLHSGDAFTVYPGKNGPLKSLRGLVFFEALQDISLCKKLEAYIGKDAVVQLIEEEAGMELTFKQYPRNNVFLPNVTEKIKAEIKKHL